MVNVMCQSKQLKGTEVYVNEHLTKKNAEIARNGRILREQNKIHSREMVLVKLNGPPEQAMVVVVQSLRELVG